MKNTDNPFTIEIDGIRYAKTQDDRSNSFDEDSRSIHIMENSAGEYRLQDGDTQHKINVVEFDLYARTCTVEMDGQLKQVRIIRELDIMIEKMGLNATHSIKQSLMVAPMPGLVTEIKVTIGEHVDKGTPLLILEAMKMENVISAPHEAVIKEIKVNVGQAVERGLPLLEFS